MAGDPWGDEVKKVMAMTQQRVPLSREVVDWLRGAHAAVAAELLSATDVVEADHLLLPGLLLEDPEEKAGWLTLAAVPRMFSRVAVVAEPCPASVPRQVLLLARLLKSDFNLVEHDRKVGRERKKGKVPRGLPEGVDLPPLMDEAVAATMVLGPSEAESGGFARKRPAKAPMATEAAPKRKPTAEAGGRRELPEPGFALEDLWTPGEDEAGVEEDDDVMPEQIGDFHLRPYRWKSAHGKCRTPEERAKLADAVCEPVLRALPAAGPLLLGGEEQPTEQKSAWAAMVRESVATMRAMLLGTSVLNEEVVIRLWTMSTSALAAATGNAGWRDALRFLRLRAREWPEERMLRGTTERETRLFRTIKDCRAATAKALRAANREQGGQAGGSKPKTFRKDDTHVHKRAF